MRKKGWKRRVMSTVLAVALVIAQLGVWYTGEEVVYAAESWTDTTLVTNGDFETELSEDGQIVGWTITTGEGIASIKTDGSATNNKTQLFKIYSASGAAFSMNQEITNVPAGTYRLVFEQDGATVTSGLSVSVNGTSKTLDATTGWDAWTTVTTDSFAVEENDTVTITIYGTVAAGYWGDFDNFVLQKYSEGDEDAETTVDSFLDDFNSDTDGWSTTWSSGTAATFKSNSDGTPFKTAGLNIYSGTAQTLTATYTVSNLAAGTYALSMKNAGEKLSATVKVSGENVKETTKQLTLGAWNSPADNKTSSFIVSQKTDLTITLTVEFQAEGWGWIDDVELAQSTGETIDEAEYEVSIAATADSVEVGNSITLTATVTKDGVNVTDLEGAGLHLYWWTTSDDQLKWLAYRDEDGYSFTVKVNPTELGTCKVNAELQNDAETQIALAQKTVTATACTTAEKGDLNITKVADLPTDFIMGMDISSVISEFDSGVTYKDYDGNTIDNVTDFCKFLASNGITHIRVRVWNDPYNSNGNGYGGGNNDVAKAKQIADGCRAAGIKMLVDFHCSDLWTDPSKQKAPKEWAGYTLDQKKSALREFIKTSLNTIDPNKDTVAMVQVGNETTSGFVGETTVGNMCTLFSAGSAGVRDYNLGVKVVIHVTNPEKGNVTKWAKNLSDNSVDYDILATSYYPYWHGTLDNLKKEFATVKATYGKDVMVAETSYAYTLNDSDGHDNTVRVGKYDTGGDTTEPFTEQGQGTSIRNLIAAVNAVGGLGVFYWEPAWLTVGDTTGLTGDALEQQIARNREKWETYGSGWASSYAAEYDAEDAGVWYGGAAVDNEAMFYPDGTPTPGLHVWNYVKTGAVNEKVAVDSVGTSEQLNKTIKVGESHQLPMAITVAYTSGSVEEPVTWNTSDVSKLKADQTGTYQVSGTVTFSETITQGSYKGKTSADVVYTLTVLPANLITDIDDAEFNKGDNFEVSGTALKKIPSNEDAYAGTYCMHWYNNASDAATGTVTYKKEIALERGDYVFEVVAAGLSGDKVTLQILDTEDKVLYEGEANSLTGHGNWQTPEVAFSLSGSTTIKLRILVETAAGGWGSVDCLYLYNKASTTGSTTPTPPTNSYTGSYGGSYSGSSSSTTEDKPNDTTTEDSTSADNTPADNTTVTENPDGTTTETKTQTAENEAGNTVETTVTTEKDKDGNITGSSEVSVIEKAAGKTSATVTVSKDADGNVTEATADVTTVGTTSGKNVVGSISGKVVSQITEAAGDTSVEITVNVTNSKGKTKYTITADSEDLTAGNKLKVVAVDAQTGEYVLVNAKTYTVTKAGSVKVTLASGKDYELLTTKEAKAVEKAVLATVKVKKTSATVKPGKTTTVQMSSKLNMDNVASITYTSSKKTVATVSKNGKVTAKKAGTVTIKATVTLNNGATKKVTMKIKVKK